ncbi:MAG TPA: hypothetical protein VEF34_08040 [Syntrophobacteraceae bacterium]|nr:hypothetical protein [Syntrophobacteraceae bacterium]
MPQRRRDCAAKRIIGEQFQMPGFDRKVMEKSGKVFYNATSAELMKCRLFRLEVNDERVDHSQVGKMSGMREPKYWNQVDSNDLSSMDQQVTGSPGGEDLRQKVPAVRKPISGLS